MDKLKLFLENTPMAPLSTFLATFMQVSSL